MQRRGGSGWTRSRRRACVVGWCAASLVVALAAGARPVAAQASSTAASAEGKSQIARDLFERGKAKWSLAEYEEAASLLAASHQQLPRAGTLLLLGDAYEHLGRLRTARDTFRLASELARDTGDAQIEYRANTREAALWPRLPRVEIRVTAPLPNGLLVTLNGHELPAAELNVSTAFDAGSYRLEAHAPGHEPFALQFQLTNDPAPELGARLIAVHLEPHGQVRATGSRATPEAADDPRTERETLAWWIGGAGAVVALAGAASMIVAFEKNGESKDHCGLDANAATNDENACTPQGVDLRESARLFAHLATVGGAVGIAGIAAGLTLYLSAGPDHAPSAAGLRWSATF